MTLKLTIVLIVVFIQFYLLKIKRNSNSLSKEMKSFKKNLFVYCTLGMFLTAKSRPIRCHRKGFVVVVNILSVNLVNPAFV